MASCDQPAVLFLVPGDPEQKTGGYRYVSQLVAALNASGVRARVHGLAGVFPIPDKAAKSAMDTALSGCADDALVILDGLAMGGMPEVIESHADRLRLWSLVHHPLADETGLAQQDADFLFDAESRALAAVDRVLVTSPHTRDRLLAFNVQSDRVHVVEPGANTIKPTISAVEEVGSNSVPKLLCVATLSPRKAQHQLIDALCQLQHLPWQCSLVGSLEREPEYAELIRQQIRALKLEGRVSLLGELGDEALAQQYSQAHCFVLPSLYEGYGMVIDEALAAGLPVISSNGGALAKTGDRPGVLLYPSGSVEALQRQLESCLASADSLNALAADARQSAETMRPWSQAARECADALGLADSKQDHSQFDLEWLRLREPADHRARNQDLLGKVQHWAESQGDSDPLRIVDLGAGAGSNGILLSGALPTPQRWTLLDQDRSLLDQAKARLCSGQIAVEAVPSRLDAGNLELFLPVDTNLVTASALIDLVSGSWLDALASAANTRRAAVYIVISYAGGFNLMPAHPDDGFVRSLVNQHQHGDKGSGAALGPDATGHLKAALEDRGYRVLVGPSPWNLGGADSPLQASLITGWAEAAVEQCPAQASRIRCWQSQRLAEADRGALTVQVDHEDLFAWPCDD